MKELGLSLTQARQLLDGITLEELQGMLMLRRAQLEQELEAHQNQLLGVEARLRYIAREGAMPADDIIVKTIPAMGVVALAAPTPGWGPANIVPVVNQLRALFDQLGISERVKEAGPLMIFYAHDQGSNVVVHLALPVVEQPAELPPPAQYLVLPEIEAATAVRSGPAASIFPFVYHDLTSWIEAQGYQSQPARPRGVDQRDRRRRRRRPAGVRDPAAVHPHRVRRRWGHSRTGARADRASAARPRSARPAASGRRASRPGPRPRRAAPDPIRTTSPGRSPGGGARRRWCRSAGACHPG